MDVLLLSRLQFAVACFFHFLFVPLTLGLVILVAVMETRWVRTGDESWRRMARRARRFAPRHLGIAGSDDHPVSGCDEGGV